MIARGRFLGLLEEKFLGKIPADRNDLTRPGDAGASPQKRRPSAIMIAASSGMDLDHPPIALTPSLAVHSETGLSEEMEPGGGESIEHSIMGL